MKKGHEAFEQLLESLADDVLKNLIKDSIEDNEKHELRILSMDRECLHLHSEYYDAHKDLLDDIELEKDRLEIEVNQKLKAFIREREEKIKIKKRNFWESVYQKHQLDPNKRYTKKGLSVYEIVGE